MPRAAVSAERSATKKALQRAGLTLADIDGYFCAGDAPGLGAMSMIEYMGIRPRHVDTTETGGSSYLIHVSHAAQAMELGLDGVLLISAVAQAGVIGKPDPVRGEIIKALNTSEMRQRLADEGADVEPSTPAELARFVRAEIVKWAKAVKDSGAQVD